MKKSLPVHQRMLGDLRRAARTAGLSDAEWARRAGVRVETLSRLKDRASCDVDTLLRLAGVVRARLDVTWAEANPDGSPVHWPASVMREDEERLVAFLAQRSLEPRLWLQQGAPFFMAGVAVLLASLAEFDRRRYLDLAETLHPGASTPEVFQMWLDRSPLQLSRFVPMLLMEAEHAA